MANKKRLIDANALIAYFDNQYNAAMDDPDPVSGYVMAALRCCIDYFKTIPTVDAVEVVHGRWEQCFEDWRKQIEGDDGGLPNVFAVCCVPGLDQCQLGSFPAVLQEVWRQEWLTFTSGVVSV